MKMESRNHVLLIAAIVVLCAVGCGAGGRKVRAGPGEPCAGYSDCQSSLYCIEGLCRTADTVETGGMEGAPCQYDIQCMPPLRCDFGQCRPMNLTAECGMGSDLCMD